MTAGKAWENVGVKLRVTAVEPRPVEPRLRLLLFMAKKLAHWARIRKSEKTSN